ncbi:QcrA Rieske Fe-S protein [Candidatus Nanopelagicaceae bacterium]
MEKDISRRTVLCGLALISAGLTSAATPAIAATGIKILKNGKVEVTLKSNSALNKVGGVVRVDGVNGQSFALVRTTAAANGYTAINLSCTHQGVIVEQSGNGWACVNGHGATYTLAGKNLVGPATKALKQLPIKATALVVTIG